MEGWSKHTRVGVPPRDMLQRLEVVKHKALVGTNRREDAPTRVHRQPSDGTRVHAERRRLAAAVKHPHGALGRRHHHLAARPHRRRDGLANVERPLHRVGRHRVDVGLAVQPADDRVARLGVEGGRLRDRQVGVGALLERGHVVGRRPALRDRALLAALH